MVLVLLRQGGPAVSVTSAGIKQMLVENGYNGIDAECPWCSREQSWWLPSTSCNERGLPCEAADCGFRLDLSEGPPVIICSRCDEELEPGDGCYRCRWCRREVRPAVTTKTGT